MANTILFELTFPDATKSGFLGMILATKHLTCIFWQQAAYLDLASLKEAEERKK